MSKKTTFSSLDRESRISRLSNTTYDILIIGGGVTGSGIALDAASRGLNTALVEKQDFASGTSSKSTKLIHGGLRYLKQLEIALVRESGKERAIVNRLAPHLCIPEKMLLPLIKNGTFGKLSTSIGLWFYDLLADVQGDEKRIMLDKAEALKKEPLLNDSILEGAGHYTEYRTDDARLTIELVKKASEFGADPINYVKVESFINEGDKIIGVQCKNVLSGKEFSIKAKKIVAAAGPWLDTLLRKENKEVSKKLLLTKGVHIVVPHERLAIKQAVYFDVPDGRMIFAIPRGRVTYIGTTDTVYKGFLDRVVSTEADIDYLLKAVNHMFPNVNITRYHIVSSWAGLRPLIFEEGKSPSEISRKDEVFESKEGLISIAGGKLTGYRKMAEKIVDKVVRELDYPKSLRSKDSITKSIGLTQDPFEDNDEVGALINVLQKKCEEIGLHEYYAWNLVTNYGKKAEEILKSVSDYHEADIANNLILAELDFCIEHEMIQSVGDFFIRRTGRLYFDIQSIRDSSELVLKTMSKRLGWSPVRTEEEKQRLQALIKDATHFYSDERVQPINFRKTASV